VLSLLVSSSAGGRGVAPEPPLAAPVPVLRDNPRTRQGCPLRAACGWPWLALVGAAQG